jgi:hypothetical protein
MSGRVLPVLGRTIGGMVEAMLVVRRDRPLLRSQLSWGAAWTAEWVFTTVLSVYAYRQGGDLRAQRSPNSVRWMRTLVEEPVPRRLTLAQAAVGQGGVVD